MARLLSDPVGYLKHGSFGLRLSWPSIQKKSKMCAIISNLLKDNKMCRIFVLNTTLALSAGDTGVSAGDTLAVQPAPPVGPSHSL